MYSVQTQLLFITHKQLYVTANIQPPSG